MNDKYVINRYNMIDRYINTAEESRVCANRDGELKRRIKPSFPPPPPFPTHTHTTIQYPNQSPMIKNKLNIRAKLTLYREITTGEKKRYNVWRCPTDLYQPVNAGELD